MKHIIQSKTLKRNKETKLFRFAAMAMSLSAAAIVGYAVMKPAPATVEAHAYTSENKITVVANEQKVSKAQAEQSIETADMDDEEKPAETSQTLVPAQPISSLSETYFVPFDEVEPTPAPAPQAAFVQSSLIGTDGIWHISYVPAWGAASAPEDGSIGIWADGWFIAHSGMVNGDTIAALPQYVEVDGQVYTLTDTWVSGDSADTSAIARARANHGIVFQTCITETTNRMVHYEPVNSAGYDYHFTVYPYTTQDAVVFGF
ncbi:hypothetical protein IM774_07120 [Erysipelotrichaceae bacterium RD49]|nr:hypothetical protein [Erysipelotrichaceae bacterium RD49]